MSDEKLIHVLLTKGEARALMGADHPEASFEGYPYWLLDRAQWNVQAALDGKDRSPDYDDERPPLPPDAPKLVLPDVH